MVSQVSQIVYKRGEKERYTKKAGTHINWLPIHSIVVDSHLDMYVAEIMGIHRGTPFLPTRTTRMIQKFLRKQLQLNDS